MFKSSSTFFLGNRKEIISSSLFLNKLSESFTQIHILIILFPEPHVADMSDISNKKYQKLTPLSVRLKGIGIIKLDFLEKKKISFLKLGFERAEDNQ